MALKIDNEMSATRIHAGTLTQSTGRPYETWKVHPHALPFEPVAQVQVFEDAAGVWCYWPVGVSKRAIEWGEKLADRRNLEDLRAEVSPCSPEA